jgi:hypothetical protein
MKKILVMTFLTILAQASFAQTYDCEAISKTKYLQENTGNGNIRSEDHIWVHNLQVPIDGQSRVFSVKDYDFLGLSLAKKGAVVIETGFRTNFYISVGFTENIDTIIDFHGGYHVSNSDVRLNQNSDTLPKNLNIYFRKGDYEKEGETFYQLICDLKE